MPDSLIIGSIILAIVALVGFAIRKKNKSLPQKQMINEDPCTWGAEGFVSTTQCLQTSIRKNGQTKTKKKAALGAAFAS